MDLSKIELEELQKMFKEGKIKEEDIPEEQRKALKELYHKQIKALEDSIEKDRQEIIKIRKQL